ncbi:hypothetical protein BIW11_07302 [Tropilaelaps mercedesae]|uniref:Uncharacterized protein n=1 Tax=Tropilaelaps mercedesae TaxID=418985 RepID=A0A1V9XUI0_9ACAR|nr:hypothetical protein BIW11_07302 [Tropilaelaps mercedesae]
MSEVRLRGPQSRSLRLPRTGARLGAMQALRLQLLRLSDLPLVRSRTPHPIYTSERSEDLLV